MHAHASHMRPCLPLGLSQHHSVPSGSKTNTPLFPQDPRPTPLCSLRTQDQHPSVPSEPKTNTPLFPQDPRPTPLCYLRTQDQHPQFPQDPRPTPLCSLRTNSLLMSLLERCRDHSESVQCLALAPQLVAHAQSRNQTVKVNLNSLITRNTVTIIL